MVHWIEPAFSKARVRAAGKRIRDDAYTDEDIEVLENWRACHSYVLNTFQATLRTRSRGQNITVAQRLKRRSTIFDKLRREPTMQLPSMHDIAGCRLIFENEQVLWQFRKSLHASRAKHKLKNRDSDQYNYIGHPKRSGYRGVHDVYEYSVSSAKGVKWNGLLIEIQYRTIFQHAWATAVEVADLITHNRIKFSEADVNHRRFFQLASEIIARSCEQSYGCLPHLRNWEVIDEFEALNRKLGLMLAFGNLRQSQQKFSLKMNTLLIFRMDAPVEDDDLLVETYDSINKAIERYEELEKSNPGNLDIVLVRADTSESVRDAFRNYFSDAHDFVRYIKDGCATLASDPEGLASRAA